MRVRDVLPYLLFKGFLFFLKVLPYSLRLGFVACLIHLVSFLIPRYRRIAHRNLELAFPDKDIQWRNKIIKGTCRTLAGVFVDFARIPDLPDDWPREHMHCSSLDRVLEVKRQNPGKGIFYITGHLGSFELLPYWAAYHVEKTSVVVRDFKSKAIGEWWSSIRGHTYDVINKKGAVKGILKSLKNGTDVGILFDQNQTRSNSVFVDWFGKLAATTRGLGYIILKSQVPVFLMGIFPKGSDNYEVRAREYDFSDLYRDETLSDEQKVLKITQDLSNGFQEYIKEYPEGWFWMHRRWKTTPDDNTPEDFYEGC